jgi:hypothetical protein
MEDEMTYPDLNRPTLLATYPIWRITTVPNPTPTSQGDVIMTVAEPDTTNRAAVEPGIIAAAEYLSSEYDWPNYLGPYPRRLYVYRINPPAADLIRDVGPTPEQHT